MENKKYEGLDKSFYVEPKKSLVERITGSKKVMTGFAITTALVGSVVIGANISCRTNDPTMFVCPITKLETMLFGYEAGLKHQAHDLEGYSHYLQGDGRSVQIATSDVQYVDGETIYYAPNGGVLTQDEAGKMVVQQTVQATANNIVDENGNVQTIHSVPAGYVLEGDKGVKESQPLTMYGSKVEYTLDYLENGEIYNTYNESWSYQDGEYIFDRELVSKKSR